MIVNYLTTNKQLQKSFHEGSGTVELYEILKKSDFESIRRTTWAYR